MNKIFTLIQTPGEYEIDDVICLGSFSSLDKAEEYLKDKSNAFLTQLELFECRVDIPSVICTYEFNIKTRKFFPSYGQIGVIR